MPAALVIGSMVPDFPYFVPGTYDRLLTHSFAAIFWFCLPTSVCVFFLYDRVMKVPVSLLLPSAIRRRIGQVTRMPLAPETLLAVCVSATLGAATHVLWDSFSHAHGAVVVRSPALQILVAEPWGYPLWGYKIVQHGSSVAGAAILAAYCWRWYRTSPVDDAPRPTERGAAPGSLVLGSAAIVALFFGAARGLRRAPDEVSVQALQVVLKYVAVSGLGCFAGLLLLYSILWHVRARSRAT